jgi:hypothetical protein
MKKIFLLFLLSFTFAVSAQQGVNTFKIKREQNIVKAVFDNNDYKLVPIDKYGNPKENEFASFTLWIKEKRSTKKFVSGTGFMTPEMLQELKSLKKATKIFFTNIKVKEDDEHFADLPDIIDTWFPDCKNCSNKNNMGY